MDSEYYQIIGKMTVDFFRQVAALRKEVESLGGFVKKLHEENEDLRSRLRGETDGSMGT